MSDNVVPLGKKKKIKNEKSNEEMSFEEIIRRNKENEDRVKKERESKNKKITRTLKK